MPSKLFTSNTDKTAEGASSSGLAAVEKPTENNMCFRTSNRKASFGSLAVFVCSCMTLRPCGRFFPGPFVGLPRACQIQMALEWWALFFRFDTSVSRCFSREIWSLCGLKCHLGGVMMNTHDVAQWQHHMCAIPAHPSFPLSHRQG